MKTRAELGAAALDALTAKPLFESDFQGSVRCANVVKATLQNMGLTELKYQKISETHTRWYYDPPITVDLALDITPSDIAQTAGGGKKTVAEFAAWQTRYKPIIGMTELCGHGVMRCVCKECQVKKDNFTEADLRQMIENRDYLIEEYRKQIEMLKDPVVVHMGMLRGGIAKLSWENVKHLYPEHFKEEDNG